MWHCLHDYALANLIQYRCVRDGRRDRWTTSQSLATEYCPLSGVWLTKGQIPRSTGVWLVDLLGGTSQTHCQSQSSNTSQRHLACKATMLAVGSQDTRQRTVFCCKRPWSCSSNNLYHSKQCKLKDSDECDISFVVLWYVVCSYCKVSAKLGISITKKLHSTTVLFSVRSLAMVPSRRYYSIAGSSTV